VSILIGAETVEILAGGHVVRRVPLSPSARNHAGLMLSAITAARSHTREWSLRLPLMLVADVVALEAELDAVGQVTVVGTLIDPDNTVDCYATNVQRQMDGLTFARLSFDLVEADWTDAGVGYSVEASGDSFSVSDSDTDSLRFLDLGSGTFEVDASGTITAKVTTIGRFKVED